MKLVAHQQHLRLLLSFLLALLGWAEPFHVTNWSSDGNVICRWPSTKLLLAFPFEMQHCHNLKCRLVNANSFGDISFSRFYKYYYIFAFLVPYPLKYPWVENPHIPRPFYLLIFVYVNLLCFFKHLLNFFSQHILILGYLFASLHLC